LAASTKFTKQVWPRLGGRGLYLAPIQRLKPTRAQRRRGSSSTGVHSLDGSIYASW